MLKFLPRAWTEYAATLSGSSSFEDKLFNKLRSKGQVGSVDDMLYNQLGDKGFTGSLMDRVFSFNSTSGTTIEFLFGDEGAARFDGMNDWLNRGGALTGVTDSKQGTVSLWVRPTGGDATNMSLLYNDTARFLVLRNGSNLIRIRGQTSDPATAFDLITAGTVTVSSGWAHVLASWDLATTTAHLYLNGVSDTGTTNIVNDAIIDYTGAEWSVGATTAGASLFTGDMAEVWFAPGVYIDLSDAANRALFRTPNGYPVDLSGLGTPAVYLSGSGNDFATNRGTGGGFTVNGSLEAAEAP